MNDATFTHLLKQLTDDDWQAVIEGHGVLIIDDLYLGIGSANAPNSIICAPVEDKLTAAMLKRQAIANAGSYLTNYYLTHPLTLVGFNRQAQILLKKYGAAAFTAMMGQAPQRTFFVDGGEVMAESADSPRHPYGVFCELVHPIPLSAIEKHVAKWLRAGEAHERYLEMNVCRYNC